MKFSKNNLKSGGVKAAIVLALAVTFALMIPIAIGASDYSPDHDPLITLSYLNEVVIPQMKDAIMQTLSGVIDQKLAGAAIAGSVTAEKPNTYEVVELKSGQRLIAEGSVEFILRQGGQAKVISPFADMGLSDLTHGTELLDGAEISQNSYCMIPRGDGRGIVATSSVAYIMVRGAYSIAK